MVVGHAARVDAFAAGTHKWLLGLAGVGVLYLREGLLPLLQPIRAGADAIVGDDDSLADGYPFVLRPDARRVEDGAGNEVGVVVLGESLGVIERVGLTAVGEQVRLVTDRLCDGIVAAGGRVRSPRHGEMWSGIVALEPPPGVDVDALWRRMLDARIAIGARRGALWAGAHFYTNEADADRVLSLVD